MTELEAQQKIESNLKKITRNVQIAIFFGIVGSVLMAIRLYTVIAYGK